MRAKRTVKAGSASANILATLNGSMRTGQVQFGIDAAPVTMVYGGGSTLAAPEPTLEGRNASSSRTSLDSPYERGRGFSAKVAKAIAKRPVMQGLLAQFISDMRWVVRTLGGSCTVRALRRGLRELGWGQLNSVRQSFEDKVRSPHSGLRLANGIVSL